MEATTQNPPCPLSLSSFPLTSFPPLTLFSLSPCTSPLALSLSRSQCPPSATGELKECCSPTDSTTDSWFLYRWRINVPALQRGSGGGLRKSKKSCNNETRIPWREYEKRYCLKQLLYSRFHKERVLFEQSAVDQGKPFKWFEWKKSAP